ncbi:hypothetical protein BDV09DRAFT_176603 [Aspergillus tetrazonus]
MVRQRANIARAARVRRNGLLLGAGELKKASVLVYFIWVIIHPEVSTNVYEY